MSVTIRDVAIAAGVSPMAVSKVLHGRGSNVRVSVEKAEFIKKVATDLNYTPNNVARSLRGGRTKGIALVFDQFGPIASGSRYFAHLIDGMTRAAFAAGYSVTLCPELSSNSAYNIGDGRFDGVIWGKSHVQSEVIHAATRSGVKIVHLHVPPGNPERPDGTYLCCDNEQGIRLALEHLAELGHRKICFVQEVQSQKNSEAGVREKVFFDISRSLGLTVDDESVAVWSYDGDEAKAWLSQSNHTALLLRTESLALPLYRYAQELGIRIPQDLSVVGFDSTEFCDLLNPRLTSISQPIEQMAHRAVSLLIDLLDGRTSSGQYVTFPCGFDLRASTARPSSQS